MPDDLQTRAAPLRRRWISASTEITGILKLGRESQQNPSVVTEFKGRFRVLEKYYSKFEELTEQLTDLYEEFGKKSEFPGTNVEGDKGAIDTMRRYYLEAHVIYEEHQSKVQQQLCNTVPSHSAAADNRSSSHLPKLSIPTFDGELIRWPQFRDCYTSMVHNDPALSPVEKFHYLLSSVKGNAASLICQLPIEEANYEIAWNSLKNAFDNKRMLAVLYLNQLLSFKPNLGKPTIESYKAFLSQISDNVSAFKLLNIPSESDFILFFLASRCLDSHTREQFEFSLTEDYPTISALTTFVRERYIALQLAEANLPVKSSSSSNPDNASKKPYDHSSSKSKPYPSQYARTSLLASMDSKESSGNISLEPNTQQRPPCAICENSNHAIFNCPTFYMIPVKQRLEQLKGWHGCKMCLSEFHNSSKCPSKRLCRFCTGKHNSFLCLKYLQEEAIPCVNLSHQSGPSSQKTPSTTAMGTTLTSNSHSPIEQQVILGTAWAHIRDARGIFQRIRLIVDSGSQYSYITHKCLLRLGLNMNRVPRMISCLGGTLYEGAKGTVSCVLRPSNGNPIELTTDAVVVKTITSLLPNVSISEKIWKKYMAFELADPKFFEPSNVDFLIGADLYSEIMTGFIESIGENLPKLFSSVFGYIVIGPIRDRNSPTGPQAGTSLFAVRENEDLSFQLENFWETEDVVTDCHIKNPADVAAEGHFKNTHYRLSTGRYVVRLPFSGHVPDISESEFISTKRFHNLENKFRRNSELKKLYSEFMEEYETLEHMQPTTDDSKYVIPHHGVLKEDRNKLKLRVVFNASCKTKNGSLNDFLLTGEPLQNKLWIILLNFRLRRYVFVCDGVKMYRQILLDKQDRIYQHIYWRPQPEQALQKFELMTVTYGLGSAPFLALRTIKQLCIDEGDSFPLAAQALERDLYVDDLATGADSLLEALELQRQVIGLFGRGCFTLGKWASNSHEILSAVNCCPGEEVSMQLNNPEDHSLKVLGLHWDPEKDVFSYRIKLPETIVFSKRAILSTVARIFDPLGFLSPSVFLMKGFIQKLWLEKLTWDQPVPEHLRKLWKEIMNQMPLLSDVKISRFIAAEKPYEFQLVGFSDASDAGFCAAIYMRVIKGSDIQVHLLTAKTRLAPVKKETCPRLELCGALLLAKLYRSMSTFCESLSCLEHDPIFFTDSAIALGWINTPAHKLKVYVANRVAQLQQLTSPTSWRHVDGISNPSDCGSRGVMPSRLIEHELWWSGPSWLAFPVDEWPQSQVQYNALDLPEMKRESDFQTALFSSSTAHLFINWMSRFSSYMKLIRVVALIRRVAHNRANSQRKTALHKGPYTWREIHDAFCVCIKLVQLHGLLHGNMRNMAKVEETYATLNPYFDGKGIIRVGGRLQNADINPAHKHQILIPLKSHFSELLVDFYHKAYLHPGPSLLQALLQTRFWIPSLRRLVRQRTFMCLRCYKSKAKSVIPVMGNLPEFRLKEGRAFLHVGIDFAGPFIMKESNRRKARHSKVYLCVFVCMVTKAIHLEAVTSLSSEAFLATFSRFMSRRGLPEAVYTDCGTNFSGASRELKELERWYKEEATQESIVNFVAQRGINWYFNPPYSPHFGGLWEAGVKSAKRHLKLVAGAVPMTYEEISTLFAKIEAVLNSRPLCPLSADPQECNYLSPGHFLIGGPLLSNPEPTLLDTRTNLLSRWQLVKRLAEEVWSRWRMEYLSTLQARNKWNNRETKSFQAGDLVLIKTKDSPPLEWPIARVVQTHPGTDGHVRVVTIKTPNSSYKRSVANLVPLLPLETKPYDTD